MTKPGNINQKVSGLEAKVIDHDKQIATIQSLTTLGFALALITAFGVVIAAVTFAVDQIHQTNEQTKTLQEIKDKIEK